MSDHEDDDIDLLAGSYVLGVLEQDEARAVEQRAQEDPRIAQAIEAWQNRLAPLADATPPAPAPAELWRRIETSVDTLAQPAGPAATSVVPLAAAPSATRRAWRSVAIWRSATAAFALAAAVAVFFLVNRPDVPSSVAALAPIGAPAPVFVAQVEPDGSLIVRPLSGVQVAAGKDLELWALPEGETKPVSLGVLPAIGRRVPAGAVPKGPAQLLVSLEPTGGSPTGAPTGAVLFGGTLKRL